MNNDQQIVRNQSCFADFSVRGADEAVVLGGSILGAAPNHSLVMNKRTTTQTRTAPNLRWVDNISK
jgi:hypothetical protein